MEKNLRKCKMCLLEKPRILAGKFDDFNKKWIDESGKSWNGSYCPDCNNLRMRTVMRNKRAPDGK